MTELPTLLEVTRIVAITQGPTRDHSRRSRMQRYMKTIRWLAAHKVQVSNVGARRVVYLAHLREAWPELYESLALAARQRRAPCEACGEVPVCECS